MAETITVLHVDDEPDVAELVATYLEREDDRFAVRSATSPQEGLDVLAEEAIDCIVSDYEMPRTDGIEFLEVVREDYPNLPFILYTGKGSEEIASEAISAGVTDYLQKETGTGQYQVLANRIVNAVAQHRAEQQIEETTQWYSRLLSYSSDFVMVVDQTGEVNYISPSVERVVGFTPDELIGTSAFEFVHPEDTDQAMDILAEIIDKPNEEPTVEFRTRHADGSWRWIEVRGQNFLNDPLIEGILVNARDITGRKHRTQELERYESFFKHATDAIALTEYRDGTAIIQEANSAFNSLFAPDEEVVGRDLDEIVASGDRVEEARDISRRLRDGEVRRGEFTRETVDGPREFLWQGIPVEHRESGEVESAVAVYTDITERKEQERELQRREEYLNQSSDIITVVDADGVVQFQNAATEDITGLSPDEVIGESGFDHVHPDDRDEISRLFSSSVEGSKPHETVELRVQTAEKGWRWIEARAVNKLDDPLIQGIIISSRDITDRKEREAELRRERSRLRALFQNAIDPIAFTEFVDGEPIVRDVNPAFEDTFGYDKESASGQPIDDLVVPDEADKRQEATDLNRRIEAGELVVTEVRRQTVDGVRDFLLQSTPLEPGENNPNTYAIYTDITERKERERTLERYETITETAGDPVYALDSEGCFTVVNDAMIEITGYQEDTLLDEHASLVMDMEDVERGEELIRSLLSSDRDRGTFEMDLVTASGRRIPVENHIGLLPFDETFQGTVGLLRDITDRKEREQEPQHQNERLDAFTSVVSHDLRNPLNVASGRLDLAQDDCDSEHLAEVDHALERMETLIDDLLELARLGETVGEQESITLTELVESCWENVETVEAALTVEIEQTITADESRLRQIFENLFRNAIEHGGDDVTITVGELDDGFYIEDDGPGIPADEREEIFEAGYSTSDEGTGFGLSIVKEVTEAHGWEISVTDGSDGGARFEITGVEFV